MGEVLVIGAGVGGLSAALHLAASGEKVTLLEKNPTVGGKIGCVEGNGFRFDTGPTLLTMPFVLRELFERLGGRLEDHLELLPVEPICRYFFSDGSQLDISNSLAKTLEGIRAISPDDVESTQRFLNRGKALYQWAAKPFLFESVRDWDLRYLRSHWKALFQIWKLDAFRTLNQVVSRTFRDPRLIQLFNRFATYNGSSPYRIPATFAMIPYVELTQGGWYVRGGLHRIAETLARLAHEKGVVIRTGVLVEEIWIQKGRVSGVRVAGGSTFEGSTIVVNADALYAFEHLIKYVNGRPTRKPRFLKGELSSSGFILLLGVRRVYPHLTQHNIFFTSDYQKEFDQIFTDRMPPEEPTIYLSLSMQGDPTMAPPGQSNMFLLVNVPSRLGPYDWATQARDYRNRVLKRLESFGLTDLEDRIVFERMMTPLDFEARTHAYRGALYGLSSHSPWAAFLRPPNRHPRVRGLYFVGGSTHPGGGIPLCLLSGKIVAELVLKYNRLNKSRSIPLFQSGRSTVL